MLMFELLRDKGILIVKPQGAINVGDFYKLARTERARAPAWLENDDQ